MFEPLMHELYGFAGEVLASSSVFISKMIRIMDTNIYGTPKMCQVVF